MCSTCDLIRETAQACIAALEARESERDAANDVLDRAHRALGKDDKLFLEDGVRAVLHERDELRAGLDRLSSWLHEAARKLSAGELLGACAGIYLECEAARALLDGKDSEMVVGADHPASAEEA